MEKIKDRVTLSILAGGAGTAAMMLIDMISAKLKISQRSYPTTAAGVWVSSRKQAESWQGQLLGSLMTVGLSMSGAFALVTLLTKHGRDNILAKGLFFGTSFGAAINAMLSGLASNKVKPKDANSNLSYILSNAFFGLTAALVASKMGHDSIFDVPPKNDWVSPTEKTTEELRHHHLNDDELDKDQYLQMGQLH